MKGQTRKAGPASQDPRAEPQGGTPGQDPHSRPTQHNPYPSILKPHPPEKILHPTQ